MTKAPGSTPVRSALRKESSLHSAVKDGLGAVKTKHREHFEPAVRSAFADSLDIDDALRHAHEEENRWDYMLGHRRSGQVIAVEPHSAKEDEIGTVIRKRRAALDQLKDHLCAGTKISKWLWVASGKVHFAATEKAKLRLDQNGIEFAGTKILAKHLPVDLPKPVARDARKRPARR